MFNLLVYSRAMVDSKRLIEVFKYNHFTLKEIAYILDIDLKTLKKKLEYGVFQSNEIECMLHFLKFPVNPMKIFFNTYDYENARKIEWWNLYRKTDQGKEALAFYLHRP